MKVIRMRTINEEIKVEITQADILRFLEKEGVINRPKAQIKAWVDIPGGGDWSNTQLEVDGNNPIKVLIQTHTLHNE